MSCGHGRKGPGEGRGWQAEPPAGGGGRRVQDTSRRVPYRDGRTPGASAPQQGRREPRALVLGQAKVEVTVTLAWPASEVWGGRGRQRRHPLGHPCLRAFLCTVLTTWQDGAVTSAVTALVTVSSRGRAGKCPVLLRAAWRCRREKARRTGLA